MNNSSLANESYVGVHRLAVELVVPILFAAITICGVVGNLAVIVVFMANRGLQDSTNALIMNLALADLMFLTFCVPFTAYSYMRSIWPFGRLLCYINVYFQYVSAYASVWTLVLLAFDRFLAVVYPVSAMQLRTVRNTLGACVFAWVIMLAVNTPLAFTSGMWEYEFEGENRSVCLDFIAVATMNATRFQVNVFYFGFNIGAYVLPLGVTCVFYIMMIRRLWRPLGDLKISREAIRVRRRITKLVWIVTLTFAICWLPQNIRYAWGAFAYPDPIMEDDSLLWFFFVSAQVLAYTNSCVNPILYGVLSERFREGIANLLRRIQGKPAKYHLHCTSSAPRFFERSTLAPLPIPEVNGTEQTEESEMLQRRSSSIVKPAKFFVGQRLAPSTTYVTNGLKPIDTAVHIGISFVDDDCDITEL